MAVGEHPRHPTILCWKLEACASVDREGVWLATNMRVGGYTNAHRHSGLLGNIAIALI